MFAASSRRCLRPAIRLLAPTRALSSLPQLSSSVEYPAVKPPSGIDKQMALGVQDLVDLYIRYGMGRQHLRLLSKMKLTTVQKWQAMMECFIGTQLHVLAGFGYTPDEEGLSAFHAQLATFAQTVDPGTQEVISGNGQDIWRLVIATTFDVDPENVEEKDIVEAREISRKASARMQSTEVLQLLQKNCALLPNADNEESDLAQRHLLVQEIIINEVYMGGKPSMMEECGFGKGEKGYARMQIAMAEHQNDPIVAQEIGTGMTRLLRSAGVNAESMR